MATFATITGPEGWKYKFTDEDWIWACRMLVGEAGRTLASDAKQAEGEAILWTMLNRLYLTRHIYTTYTKLILAYSQPINPKWRDRGTAEEQQRRAEFATMPASAIDQSITDLVTRFMQGKVPGEAYAGLVHFAAPNVAPGDSSSIGPIPLPRVAPNKSNIFYKMPATRDWPGDMLLAKFTKGATTAVIAAGLTLVALGAGVGYYFWLKAQKGTAGLGDFRKARLRKGRLTCPYCEQGVQCEMPPAICGPEDAAEKLFDMIGADKRVEGFWIFMLDPQGHLIGRKRIAVGEISEVMASPPATFRAALTYPKPVGAIITVHNHTVADPLPSQQDLNVTHTLVTLGHFLKIPVVDHLIIGSTGEYTSIRDYVDSRYGEHAFNRTMITPGGEAASSMIEKGGMKGLLGVGGDID